MLRVNSFLFCVRLESFGLFIGWFGYGMSVLVAVCSLIAASFFMAEAVISESVVRGLTTVVSLLIILILCVFVASMSIELIRGINTRNSEGVKVFRNLCSFNTFLAGFLVALSQTGETTEVQKNILLMTSWCNLLLQTYIFICIHSLALKLDERRFPSLIRHDSNTFHHEFNDDDDES